MDTDHRLSPVLAYGTLPLLLTLAVVVTGVLTDDAPSAVPPVLVTSIVVCMMIEWRRPLQRRWRMTMRSLTRRDLPFIAIGLLIERACEVAVAAIAKATVPAGGFGPIGRLPGAVQVAAGVLAFDLCWYWYHRLAHGHRRLWRVHGAHHSPSEMYVLMHGVFHPLEELVVRFVLALGVFRFAGFSPQSSTVALTLIGVIGIVSHTNADLRLWALNHLLIGPETHRIHHSADRSGNYGSATSVWDQLFNTFVFEPTPPTRLGLADPTSYPDPEHFHEVLVWPLRRAAEARRRDDGVPVT